MKIDDIRRTAYSMPLTNPSFPPGPYRFFDREYFVITYKTDPDALAAVVPEPLEITEPIVKYEFIRMPDSTGFGDYTETGQVIPIRFKGEEGVYVHSMYLDDDAPIAGGRELWGFPKKRASPKIVVESDVLGAFSSCRVPMRSRPTSSRAFLRTPDYNPWRNGRGSRSRIPSRPG
jgi:acetoacetate decarboxylase